MLVENNKYLHGIQYIELVMGNWWLQDQYTMNLESKVLHCVTNPVEMWWHTVTHTRGSEGETGEWSG